MFSKGFKLHDIVVVKIDDSQYPCIRRRYLKARIIGITDEKMEFLTQEYINCDWNTADTVMCYREYDKHCKYTTIVDIWPFEAFVIPNPDDLSDDVKIKKYKQAAFVWSDREWAKTHQFSTELPFRLPYIYRISGDYMVTHGGSCIDTLLHFPIWISDKLNVNNDILNNLISELKSIGQQNNDWRENAPILNIVDPELYTFRLKRNKFGQELLALFEKAKKTSFYDIDFDIYDYMFDHDINSNKKLTPKVLKENVTEYLNQFVTSYDMQDEDLFYEYELFRKITLPKLISSGRFIRGSYQFLATEFVELTDSKIKIISPIHNLPPKSKCRKLYKAIEHIFECMLPLFNQFKQFKNRKNKQFQCIIKAQSYILNPNSGFSGEWHQEGLTENIILSGLYYWEYDNSLSGGNLKFRNQRIPSMVDLNEKYLCYKEINLCKGKAIVFDNMNLVHRLRMLKNLTNLKNQTKSFLAFFVVDPEKPIKSTKTYPSLKREYYVRLVEKLLLKHKIGYDICCLICEYGNNGITLSFAKKFRQNAINLKKEMKGKFGHICFGNAGQNVYFPQGKMIPFIISEPYGNYECNHMEQNDFVSTTNSELTQSQ